MKSGDAHRISESGGCPQIPYGAHHSIVGRPLRSFRISKIAKRRVESSAGEQDDQATVEAMRAPHQNAPNARVAHSNTSDKTLGAAKSWRPHGDLNPSRCRERAVS